MRREDLEALRQLVQAKSGVLIDPAKTYLVESRLGPLARREGFATHTDLFNAVREKREDRLIWAVTEAMTSNETAFFRDRAVFDVFRTEVLPRLAAGRRGHPIRIWSAACASGQEPYSLAMMIEEEAAQLAGSKIELFASDLSEACLEKARSGLYTQFEVQRGLPIRLLLRYFEREGEMWRLSRALMQQVRWRRINLLADLRPLGKYEVIFCRNVIGSFDPISRKRVLIQMASLVADDGYLVLGAQETAEDIDGLHPVSGAAGLYSRNPQQRAAAA
jgi:chemotaxis protein methyltransferase CheR